MIRDRRTLAAGLLVGALVASSTACVPLRAQKLDVFVRQQPGVSIEQSAVRDGETLIKVRNDRRDESRVVLVKLLGDTRTLPVGDDGTVPVGSAADIEFEGDGYRVVARPDDLAPTYASIRTKTVVHAHLETGRYVLFSNFPGDYEAGWQLELVVT